MTHRRLLAAILLALAGSAGAATGADALRDTVEQRLRGLLGDPHAAGRVLAVDDHEVGRVALAQLRHRRLQPAPAGTSHHVPDEQDSHGR